MLRDWDAIRARAIASLSSQHSQRAAVVRERAISLLHRHYRGESWLERFDPDEPRDDAGRWTDGGGSDDGGGAGERYAPPQKPADIDDNKKVELKSAYRGSESGTEAQATLRQSKGDLGTGIYFTLERWLAGTYGGGPGASEETGTRTVREWAIKPMFPEEVAFVFGGQKYGDQAQIYSGNGVKLGDVDPGKSANFEALLNQHPDIKAVIGTPDSIGVNQISVRDKSIIAEEIKNESKSWLERFDPNEPRDTAGRWTDGDESAEGAGERVSTAVPSAAAAKKQGSDPHQRQDLSPSYKTFQQAMNNPAYAKGVDKLMDRYGSEFLRLPKDATPLQKSEAFVEHAKSNILALYDAQKPDLRGRSAMWYRGANKIAKDMASKYGVSPRAVAGVLASLSPQRDWDQNVEMAKRVLDIAVKNKDVPITGDAAARTRTAMLDYANAQLADADKLEAKLPAGADKKDPKIRGILLKIENRRDAAKQIDDLADTFEGKTLSQIPDVMRQAMVMRFYDEGNAEPGRGYTIWNPEGTPSGDIARTKTGEARQSGWGSFPMAANALGVLANDSRANISSLLGDNHKVRNFYNNIIAPDYGKDATIDTHAIAAAALMPLGGNDALVGEGLGSAGPKNAETGLKSIYALYSEAYQRAAQARDIKPREMQSTTWEAVRGLFNPEEKRDPKLEARINDIWQQYRQGKIELGAAQKQILDRGIRPPRWAKSFARYDARAGLGAARG